MPLYSHCECGFTLKCAGRCAILHSASLISSGPSTPASAHGDERIKGFLQVLRTEAVVGERGWAAIKFTLLGQHFYLGAYFRGYK